MTRTFTARTSAAAAVFAAVALLAACGSSGDGASTDGGDTTTEAAAVTTTAASTTTGGDDATTTAADGGDTTTTLSSEGRDTETTKLDTLPDGDHYVYMAGLEQGKVEGQDVQVVIVDPVEMLTGQAAIDAAADDGVELDTDYYIRNTEQTVKRIGVAPDASATALQEGTSGTIPSSVSEVAMQDNLFQVNASNVRGITLINSISAVYLP